MLSQIGSTSDIWLNLPVLKTELNDNFKTATPILTLTLKSGGKTLKLSRGKHEMNVIRSAIWQVISQPLFWALYYISKDQVVAIYLFLLNYFTFYFSLCPIWKRVKCSPRQSKFSLIFPGEHAPGSPVEICIFTTHTLLRTPTPLMQQISENETPVYTESLVTW